MRLYFNEFHHYWYKKVQALLHQLGLHHLEDTTLSNGERWITCRGCGLHGKLVPPDPMEVYKTSFGLLAASPRMGVRITGVKEWH